VTPDQSTYCSEPIDEKEVGRMTEPQDQFTALTNHSPEAITTAVSGWADTVQSVAGRAGWPALPDLTRVVDQYFSFAEKILADQRQLAHQWAAATVSASATVTEQAQRAGQSVSAHSANAAEAVVDNTADTARTAARTVVTTSPVGDTADS
jgi:hypothetical protein